MSEEHISEEQLWEVVDGSILNSAEQQHLDACSLCQNQLQLVRALESELKRLPQTEPSMSFTAQVVKSRKERIAFPWFVSILAGIFSLLFGLSIYVAVTADVQVANPWFRMLSFTLIILILLYFELKTRRKSTVKVS